MAEFGRLVERWQQPLLNYAYRLMGDWAVAEGVVQETWMVVIRGLVGLRDVTRARGHFHPSMGGAGKGARVWISVRAEGNEPMYTGPVEPGMILCFGQPTVGRYVIKGRTERADGGFTFRLGGWMRFPRARLSVAFS